jgi:phthiodiolone/phenolphthiodiolone dimycocerosates ketoreductase
VGELKFGYTGQVGPPLDRALRAMARVEAQGWDFIRFPDQMGSTHPYGMMPGDVASPDDPEALICSYGSQWSGSFELLTATAISTSELAMHGAVIDPLRRSPSVFAQEAVTVSHFSHGRASWCIGSGEAKQFEPFGEKRFKPAERMVEAVKVMQTLWDNPYRPVSRDSEYWPLKDAVFPMPLFEDRKPNILVVGGGEAIERLAGEDCDGWMTFLPGGALDDPIGLAKTISRVKSYAARAGRDPESIRFAAMAMVVIANTDAEAHAVARHPVLAWSSLWAFGAASGKMWKKEGFEHPYGEDAAWPKNMKVSSAFSVDEIERLPSLVPEQITDSSIIWGNPERVIGRLEPFVEAGLTELSFLNCAPWTEPRLGPDFPALASQVIVGLGGRPLKLDV